jgi:hypothetical protein
MSPRRSRKPRGPKKVAYTLLSRAEHPSEYKLVDTLVKAHHSELKDARVALAWCTSWRADVDGRAKLGQCRRATELDRELMAYDFVICCKKIFGRMSPCRTSNARPSWITNSVTRRSSSIPTPTSRSKTSAAASSTVYGNTISKSSTRSPSVTGAGNAISNGSRPRSIAGNTPSKPGCRSARRTSPAVVGSTQTH